MDSAAQSPAIVSNAPSLQKTFNQTVTESHTTNGQLAGNPLLNFIGSLLHANVGVKTEDDHEADAQFVIDDVGSPQMLNSPSLISKPRKNPTDVILSSANNIIVTGSAIPLRPLPHLKQRRAVSRSPAQRHMSLGQLDGGNSSHDSDLLDGSGSANQTEKKQKRRNLPPIGAMMSGYHHPFGPIPCVYVLNTTPVPALYPYHHAGNANYRRTLQNGAMDMSPAPIEAVLLHSPTPSPPSGDSHNFRPLSAASEISPQKRKRRTKDEGIKGLRYFALQVCEKVRTKRQTNYNSVAEELVQEHTKPPYFQPSLYTPDQIAGEQKNIRRRVYDALNVLMALNIIQRDGRDIRWNGFPRVLSEAGLSVEDSRVNRRRRLIQAEQDTMELLLGTIGTMHVIDENRSRQNKVPSVDLLNTLNIGVDSDMLRSFIADNCMDHNSQAGGRATIELSSQQQFSQESTVSIVLDQMDSCPQYRHPSDLLSKAEAACSRKAGKSPSAPVVSGSSSAVSMERQRPRHRVTQREPDEEFAQSSSSILNSSADLLASYQQNNNSNEQLNADQFQRNTKKGLQNNNKSSASYAGVMPENTARNHEQPNSDPISSAATSTSSLLSASTSSVATGASTSSAAASSGGSGLHADYVMHEPAASLPAHADHQGVADVIDAHHPSDENILANDFAAELHSLGPHTSFGSIGNLSDTADMMIDDTISVSQLYAMQTDMQEPPRPPSYYAYEADHNPYGGGTNNFDYYQQRYGHFYHKQDRQQAAAATRTTAANEAHEMDFADIATLPHNAAGSNTQTNSLYYQNNNGNVAHLSQHDASCAVGGGGGAADSARVYKPFLFVVSPLDAALDCSIATDQTNYEIKFSTPFKVYDEMEVMRMQPYALRFEKQQMTPEEREKALSYLPDKLRRGYEYIKSQLLTRRREEEEELQRRLRLELRRKEIEAQKAAALKGQHQTQNPQQVRVASSAPSGGLSGHLLGMSRPNTASSAASGSTASKTSADDSANANKRQALSGNGVLATIAAARASSANQTNASGVVGRPRKALPISASSTNAPSKHPLVKGGAGGSSFNRLSSRNPLPLLPTSSTATTMAAPATVAAARAASASSTPRPALVAVPRQQIRFPDGAVALATGARTAAVGAPGSAGGSTSETMLSSIGSNKVVASSSGGNVMTMTNGGGRSLPLISTKLTREQLQQLQREKKIIPVTVVHQNPNTSANSSAAGNVYTVGGSNWQHTTNASSQPRTYALLTTANAVASTTNTSTTVNNSRLMISPATSTTAHGVVSSSSPPMPAFSGGVVFASRNNKRLLPPSAISADTTTAVVQQVQQRVLTTSAAVGAPAAGTFVRTAAAGMRPRNLLPPQTVSIASSQNGAGNRTGPITFVKAVRKSQQLQQP